MKSNSSLYYAAVDLGTNTFHVLIARLEKDEVVEIFKKRIFVFLLRNKTLAIEGTSVNRAYKAVLYIKGIINKYNCNAVKVVGTEALRVSQNGKKIKTDLEKILGEKINIISGKEEARLTHLGVSNSLKSMNRAYTIIDIGGGSIEFIKVGKSGNFISSDSLPIGVSILAKKSNYLQKLDLDTIEPMRYFLSIYDSIIKTYSNQMVVFNGGFCEVFAAREFSVLLNNICSNIDRDRLVLVCKRLVFSDLDMRKKIDWLPWNRQENMHLCGFLLVHLINTLCPRSIIYSPYSLKEGIILSLSKN